MRLIRKRAFWIGLLLIGIGAVVGATGATIVVRQGMGRNLYERVASKLERTMYSGPVGAEEWRTAGGLRLEAHARGLRFPVRLAFPPEASSLSEGVFYYVAELGGAIRAVGADGEVRTVAEGLLNFDRSPRVELGLLGMALDAGRRQMFIALAYWDEEAGVYRNRVDRLDLDSQGLSVIDRSVVLDMDSEATVASYQIQFVSIGPDDLLYVGVGSGGHKPDAQDLEKFAGKVLRMDREGRAAADNPFFEAARPESARSYIYAYGVRNPFDLEWDREARIAIVSDVGPGLDRIFRLEKGINYCFGEAGDEGVRANALYTWGPGGSHAPTGLALAEDALLGRGEGRSLYVGLFGAPHMPGANQGKRVSRFPYHRRGYLDGPIELVTRYEGVYFNSVTDVAAGPDGLYFADLYGTGDFPHRETGVVYRLVASGEAPAEGIGVEPPVAFGSEGERAFVVHGCMACHNVEAATPAKEGPMLRGVAERLEERLSSEEYLETIDELGSRSGAYFRMQREKYDRLRSLPAEQRPRAWFGYHLNDPRFDHPEAKMPSFAHLSEQDVEALWRYLSGH